VVSGGRSFPNGRHGICGDPYYDAVPRGHEAGGSYWRVGGGRPTATFKEGDVVEFSVTMTMYHKGRFQFRICRVVGSDPGAERSQLTESCLNANRLKQASGGQEPGDYYYHLGWTPQSSYRMRYQLPRGLNCDGKNVKCVLQW
jgi:hypothetical protein